MSLNNCKLLVLLSLLVFLIPKPSPAKGIKNILILHSYHQGLQWTDNISKGMESELADISSEIELHYEYLDTKRNSGEKYFKHLVDFELFKIQLNKIKYSLILCSDNNALNFVVDYGDLLFPHVPVVFCGINNYSPELLKNKKQITGVIETIDYQSTLDLVQKIHPDRKNIVLILDRTATGTAIKSEFSKIAQANKNTFSFEYYQDFLLSEVPGKISTLGKNDLIYILTFNRDRSGNFISYTDGIRMIRNASRVPIYGSWDFYFGNGIIGGLITSGHAQGQVAARMAKRILSGESPEDIPVLTKSPNQYMFDYHEMEAFNIKKKQLPQDSYYINLPIGLFERYKKQIIGFSILITLMVIVLIWRLWVQIRRQKVLRSLNLELDRRVEEQTAKLKRKNELLTVEITERIKLEKKILKLAATDSLTGINNRRSFMEKAGAECIRSQRYKTPLSILMMDIDFFKNVNDTYGHHFGDVCLATFTRVCLKALRSNDIIGRIGGEEFAVVLVESDKDEAMLVAERLRAQVAETVITEGCISFQITVSIGVSQLIGNDSLVGDVIQRADKNLYMAKDKGRNQVVCSESY